MLSGASWNQPPQGDGYICTLLKPLLSQLVVASWSRCAHKSLRGKGPVTGAGSGHKERKTKTVGFKMEIGPMVEQKFRGKVIAS